MVQFGALKFAALVAAAVAGCLRLGHCEGASPSFDAALRVSQPALDGGPIAVYLSYQGKEYNFTLQRRTDLYASGASAKHAGKDLEPWSPGNYSTSSTFSSHGEAVVTLYRSGACKGLFFLPDTGVAVEVSGKTDEGETRSLRETSNAPHIRYLTTVEIDASIAGPVHPGCSSLEAPTSAHSGSQSRSLKKSRHSRRRRKTKDANSNDNPDTSKSARGGYSRGYVKFADGSCYPDDDKIHVAEIALKADHSFVQKLFPSGRDARSEIEWMVSAASAIYERQLNLRLAIKTLELEPSELANDCPSSSYTGAAVAINSALDTVVNNMVKSTDWKKMEGVALQILTACETFSGSALGVSYIGTSSCHGTNAYAAGITKYRTNQPSELWRAFAHELGHTFGAKHSFMGNDLTSAGGIMSYNVDGVIKGTNIVGFDYPRRKEMCSNLAALAKNGPCQYFYQASS